MGKSRNLGIFTESALRYERGVDPYLQNKAMQRATQLILEICGGEVGPINEVVSENDLPVQKTIILTQDKLLRVLGFEVAQEQVTSILQGLTMQVTHVNGEWQVIAPSSRFDMTIEEDLIEEIVRLVGYDKMPSTNLFGDSVIKSLPEELIEQNQIKSQLNTLGYQEAINYSFVSDKLLQAFGLQDHSIALKNPLTEEFSTMRTSLLPGMMETLKYNLRRQNDSIKMFETGYVFHQHESIIEDDKILAICTGKRHSEHWSMDKESVDFYDCKGDLECLLDNTKLDYQLSVSRYEYLHPGRQASVKLNGKIIGWIGQIHPEICRSIGIKKEVYAFELYMKSVQKTCMPMYQDISKYPSVRRDLAMVVNESICYQQIKDIFSENLGELLVESIVFDQYQGENIGHGKRSIAVGLVLQQKNATFEDKDVDKLIAKVVSSITQELSVEIRGN